MTDSAPSTEGVTTPPMPESKECRDCGRVGYRSFAPSGDYGWVCARDDVCRERQIRADERRARQAWVHMPATKALLREWDLSTNPIFLSAAGQLRRALSADGHGDLVRTGLVIPTKRGES